ncbi:MAG TPA: hypothetical protein PLM49_09630 [Bacteroidales bacterium]|nr:hypothetical protein [Bacteroidales bacterium]
MKKTLYFLFALLVLSSSAVVSQEDESNVSSPYSNLTGLWLGEFKQYSCGVNSSYPMKLEILSVNENLLTGFFVWEGVPYAPDSRTIMSGEIVDGKLMLTESEIVSGSNIVLNGIYEISLENADEMHGIWRLQNLEGPCKDSNALSNGGSFELTKQVAE